MTSTIKITSHNSPVVVETIDALTIDANGQPMQNAWQVTGVQVIWPETGEVQLCTTTTRMLRVVDADLDHPAVLANPRPTPPAPTPSSGQETTTTVAPVSTDVPAAGAAAAVGTGTAPLGFMSEGQTSDPSAEVGTAIKTAAESVVTNLWPAPPSN